MARVVYGVHPVREALRSGKVQALFVAEGETGPALKEIFDAARTANVQPIPHLRSQLDAMAHGGVHQGALAVVGEYNYAQLDELIQIGQREGKPALLLVLDSVQDPQNFGALVRT
ncbi:MAG: TrmH family RNA methyltransferase, partial [Polyangia bacterium]